MNLALSIVDDRRGGEGDGSLAYWLDAHRRYFKAERQALGIPFSEGIPVLCEDFRVLRPPSVLS